MQSTRHTSFRWPLALTALVLVLGCGPSEPAIGTDVGFGVEKKKDFFTHDKMFYVRIDGWDPSLTSPAALVEYQRTEGARVEIFEIDPDTSRHCPDGEGQRVYEGRDFKLRTSGNLTNGTPKSSYKLKLHKDARFVKMDTLNLKSMWNDVSQLREALAWDLFAAARVPAPRHAYARFCINGRYYGLYSVIEQVDKRMLKDHFDDLDEGNLYKAYWVNEDLGPADLTYRGDADDDGGRHYFANPELEPRTYELKENESEPELSTYDDLATLIRVLNGRHAPDVEFGSPAFAAALEEVFDVYGFLRWAGVNVLLGAWDNYYRTPSNYYLYNSGVEEGGDFMARPYFTWIPWDYDNALGSDFFGTPWHKTSIYDWAKHTATERRALPLVTNLLRNKKYLAYYLDHMECVLEHYFNVGWLEAQLGDEDGRDGLVALIRQSAYLESDSPRGAPHTGRQFTNDQVYWNGFQHHELRRGDHFLLGIWHHVNARHDSARSQIDWLRGQHALAAPAEPVCKVP